MIIKTFRIIDTGTFEINMFTEVTLEETLIKIFDNEHYRISVPMKNIGLQIGERCTKLYDSYNIFGRSYDY